MTELYLKGHSIGKIKGILFDKDGTLTNSEDHLISISKIRINESINYFKGREEKVDFIEKLNNLLSSAYGISKKGLRPNSIVAVGSREQNLISTATIFCLLGEGWSQALKTASYVFNEADKVYYNGNIEGINRPLIPGILNFLNQLRKNSIVYSIISNDNVNGIKDFLFDNNLDKEIITFWSCENKFKKPDPNAVKELCKILRVNPHDCALIGDSDSDLLMAREAGMKLALGFTGGWTEKPKLSYQHHLIHHWDEISIA
tara:strand:+ start:540 stop:1316 length:777 start_codon:yes stop_codon:yes gene_type:complete